MIGRVRDFAREHEVAVAWGAIAVALALFWGLAAALAVSLLG